MPFVSESRYRFVTILFACGFAHACCDTREEAFQGYSREVGGSMEFSVPGIIVGIVFGIIDFLPLYLASRSITPASDPHMFTLALIRVGFPMILMLAAILVCSKVAYHALLCFGCGMVGTLVLLALVYCSWYFIKRR